MKHMHIFSFFVLLLAMGALAGCTEQYEIKLNKKGQAEVKYRLFITDAEVGDSLLGTSSEADLKDMRDSMRRSFDKVYKNQPGISNYTCKIGKRLDADISYKIKDIANLGNYLSPLGLAKFNFIPGKNNLVIEAPLTGESTGEEEDEEGMDFMKEMKIEMKIEMPKPIKSIVNKSVFTTSYTGAVMTLSSNMGQLMSPATSNRIEIQY